MKFERFILFFLFPNFIVYAQILKKLGNSFTNFSSWVNVQHLMGRPCLMGQSAKGGGCAR